MRQGAVQLVGDQRGRKLRWMVGLLRPTGAGWR